MPICKLTLKQLFVKFTSNQFQLNATSTPSTRLRSHLLDQLVSGQSTEESGLSCLVWLTAPPTSSLVGCELIGELAQWEIHVVDTRYVASSILVKGVSLILCLTA